MTKDFTVVTEVTDIVMLCSVSNNNDYNNNDGLLANYFSLKSLSLNPSKQKSHECALK